MWLKVVSMFDIFWRAQRLPFFEVKMHPALLTWKENNRAKVILYETLTLGRHGDAICDEVVVTIGYTWVARNDKTTNNDVEIEWLAKIPFKIFQLRENVCTASFDELLRLYKNDLRNMIRS